MYPHKRIVANVNKVGHERVLMLFFLREKDICRNNMYTMEDMPTSPP